MHPSKTDIKDKTIIQMFSYVGSGGLLTGQ
jgi:hypothetical protein